MTRREIVVLRILFVAGIAAPGAIEFLSMRGILETDPLWSYVAGPLVSLIIAFSLSGSGWRRVLRAIAVPIGVIVLLAAALVVFDWLLPDYIRRAVPHYDSLVPASHVTGRR
jgi:hypothetical protein